MNTHRCFLFVGALALVTVLCSQEVSHHRGLEMRGGKVLDEAQLARAPGSVGPKIQIWTDRKIYLPGEEIRVLAMGLAPDATDLQIYVGETFTNTAGLVVGRDSYPCSCGDTNAGTVADLAGFQFMTLFTKRVPGLRPGYYDFDILVMKRGGVYQNTKVRVGVLVLVEDGNPIRIDQLYQVTQQAGPVRTAAAILVGRFPVGAPLFFFSGAAPYEGILNPGSTTLSSSNGQILVVPLASMSAYGRIILMTQDGSFSTTSRQEFAPMAGAANTP